MSDKQTLSDDLFDSRLFRRESLNAYLAQRQGQIYPPALNKRLTYGLWGIFTALLAGMLVFWTVQIPIYTPFQTVQSGEDNYLLTLPPQIMLTVGQMLYDDGQALVSIVEVEALTGDRVRIRTKAGGHLPEVVMIVSGYRRLGSYLPLLGMFF